MELQEPELMNRTRSVAPQCAESGFGAYVYQVGAGVGRASSGWPAVAHVERYTLFDCPWFERNDSPFRASWPTSSAACEFAGSVVRKASLLSHGSRGARNGPLQ